MSTQECAPPCRCQFVQQWLEDHAKYFGHPVSKPEPQPLVTRIANRSYPTQINYNQALQISSIGNLPFVQPPYKISPVKPPLPPVRNNYS